jgi:hypothetical protein
VYMSSSKAVMSFLALAPVPLSLQSLLDVIVSGGPLRSIQEGRMIFYTGNKLLTFRHLEERGSASDSGLRH